MAEIVRAGILSVDEGQTEAAQALGMSRLQTMRRIVLPQAMRVIIPPTGNETISMLKTTSLRRASSPAPSCCTRPRSSTAELPDDPAADRRQHLVPDRAPRVLSVGQYYLERYFGRGAARDAAADAAAAAAPRLARPPGAVVEPPRPRDAERSPMVQGRGVHKSFGRLEVLKGIDLEVAARRGVCLHRPVGLGQVDVPALHQPPGEDRRAAACGSTASWSATGRRATSSTSCASARSRASAREIGMVFQRFNLFPHMTALGERHRGADPGQAASRKARRARARPRAAGPGGAARQDRRLPARSCPAASSSGWRSPARWRWSPS